MVKIVDMTDALKQVREYTCPKCGGAECQCPQIKTMEITNADKKINSPAYQNYKSGDERYTPAEDLEEQIRKLEEEIKCLSEEMDSMIQEKRQEGFAVRFLDPANKKRFVAAFKTKKDADDKAAQLKRDGLKDISITQHTLNFKEDSLQEQRWEIEGKLGYKGIGSQDAFHMIIDAPNKEKAEDKCYDELDKARTRKKIGPGGGGYVEDVDIIDIEKTNDKLSAPETRRSGN